MHGQPLRGYKHCFDPPVREAGIRDFTWYCLRHTFASRLVMVGVGLRTIADLWGIRPFKTTMRYAHLGPAHQLAAVECLVSQPSAGSAAQAEPSDTTTDTSTESVSRVGLAAIN
jgi:Phage integrase family